MIAYIKGKIERKDPSFVNIDVNGVGYRILIPLTTYSAIKHLDSCMLHTYLHIKEDSHTLFGFYHENDKNLFLNLISINGVGPATAIMMLSSLSSEEIVNAILFEQVNTIQSVKGIGGKTAQRIILELKDKVGKEMLGKGSEQIINTQSNTIKNEALSALVTLGINKNVAEKSLNAILRNSESDISLEELIKLALKTN